MTTRTQLPPPILTNNHYGLSNDEIAARFPAVFATEAHESRGSRYLMVPTHQILDGLRNEGYVPTTVMHQRARIEKPGLVSHGKHLLRFSHINDLGIAQGERHEVIMVNAHNGTSSYRFMSGLFRLVCENGCIFGDLDSSLQVRHSGRADMLQAILNATFQIAANSVNIMEEIEQMKSIVLSWQEQLYLSEAAMATRLDGVKVVESDEGIEIDRSAVPFQPSDFLRAQRREDLTTGDEHERNLYTTYQVIQENMVTRPVTSRQRSETSRRRGHTRSLTGIDGNVKVNAALWTLTKRMAELKGQGY